MREIVIGQAVPDNIGCYACNVWFRVAIPSDTDPTNPRPGRQALYAAAQATYTPQAPGDYASAHADELTAFHAGEYVELPPISVQIDPSWKNADVAAAISSTSQNVNGDILLWLHADRVKKQLAFDDARLGLLGTNYAAGSWTPSRA